MRCTILFLALFSLSCVSSERAYPQDNFDLPIKVKCNDQWSTSEGVFLCNQVTNKPLALKIKIPPTKGSFRVVNCNRDLTSDGNPDDFDSQIWKTGWWIFSKSVQVFAGTPQIVVPLEEMRKSDCPIIVSEYADYAGGHNAVLLNAEDDRLADFLEYSCAGKPYISTGGNVTRGINGTGLGVCRGLTGAEVRIKFTAKENTVLVITGNKCKIFEKHQLKVGESSSSKFDISKGVCPVTIEAMTLKKTSRSIFLFVGIPRENYMIDSPLLVKDGGERRAILPMTATMLSVEVYNGGEIVWRSGRKDASFSFNATDFSTPNSGSNNPACGPFNEDMPGCNSSTKPSSPTTPKPTPKPTSKPTPKPGDLNDDMIFGFAEGVNVTPEATGLVACLTAYSQDSNSMSGACYDLITMKEIPYFFN